MSSSSGLPRRTLVQPHRLGDRQRRILLALRRYGRLTRSDLTVMRYNEAELEVLTQHGFVELCEGTDGASAGYVLTTVGTKLAKN